MKPNENMTWEELWEINKANRFYCNSFHIETFSGAFYFYVDGDIALDNGLTRVVVAENRTPDRCTR